MNALTEVVDPVEAVLPPAERRWLKWLRRTGWALIACYFVAGIAMLALRYWAIPHIAEYREEIAAVVSRVLGQRVEIERIDAEWFGLHPRLALDGVRVIDAHGNDALALPHIDVTLSWRSLLAFEPRFKQIVIDRPELWVRRDGSGRLFVAGLESDPEATSGAAADWLLRQDEIVIRDATVDWDDELRRAVPLRLERLTIVLRNDGRHHRFAVRGEPPAAFASAIDIRGDLVGASLEALAEWEGRLYAGFDYIDLAAWQPWIDYPFEVLDGRGALRLWLGFGGGAVTEVAADIGLSDLAARFAAELPLLAMRSMSGQLGTKKRIARRLDGTTDVAYEAFARQLQFVAESGTAFAPTDLAARWEPAAERAQPRGEIVAKSLELAPLAHFAGHVPMPEPFRRALVKMAPEGRLTNLRFSWTGDIDAPDGYSARGGFAELGMQPYGGAPGFSRLGGTFDVTERGGDVSFAGQKLALEYPGVLPAPSIPIDALGARVRWSFPRDGFEVRFDDVAIANADMNASVSGSYRTGGEGAGIVDITARASQVEGKNVYKYVPYLPQEVTQWLESSILAGRGSDVRVRLHGDLARFPFDDPKDGEFRITGHAEGGTLRFASGWPAITDAVADLAFEGRRLRITSPRANTLDARLSEAVVTIPDLFGAHARVIVDGRAEGPLGEFLRYIAQSPVREYLDGRLDPWSGTGRGRLALHLELPLEDLARSEIAGNFQFANNTIGMGPGDLKLEMVNGRVDFTQTSVTARNLTAQTLGGSMSVQLATRASDGGAMVTSVQGVFDSAQLAKLLELPVADKVQGPIQFRYEETLRGAQSQSVFESPLTDVAIDLPAPFGKPGGVSWPLKIERASLPAPSAGTRRAAISAAMGTVLKAQAQVRSEAGRTVIERAGIGVGDGEARLPDEPGIVVSAALKSLDVDRLMPAMGVAEEQSAATEFAVNALNLRADVLTFGGRLIHDLSLQARHNRALKMWNINVASRELAGDIAWEPEGKGAVAARLKHLVFPERAPDALPRRDDVIDSLPALAVFADRLVYHGRELGRLEMQAVNLKGSWRLDRLQLAAPEGMLAASGEWSRRDSGERTDLEVKVETSNIGRYLARFGYEQTVSRGTASLSGAVAWKGPINRIDFPSLAGRLTVNAEKGQFVKLDPGAGKLLGVLSLQSLPRRITLDFRDVFSEGFAFDLISGSAKIAQGVASSEGLSMSGPAATVVLTGSTDLANETQDLNVRVVPFVGDSVAVAAGIVLLNPIVGAGALIAQRILKDPLGQMFAFEYHVTGSWEDPEVEKVRAPPAMTPVFEGVPPEPEQKR